MFGGGGSNVFSTDPFGTGTGTTSNVRYPEVWPDESTLGLSYDEIVKKDKARLEKQAKAMAKASGTTVTPGTFKSEFQLYFEREPNDKKVWKLVCCFVGELGLALLASDGCSTPRGCFVSLLLYHAD